ncbi:hypothetical protein BX281_8400 [Streptomyces sp. Ag82_O1-15]|uniref:hypothetical protein n=1 Tax=Streptomyces sp. Ag82_O1-15 TaxID=1938855 RepID=UPI000BB0F901|nr:hypothetical protein [Streptomyces sp. Ag82_O1-15]PBD00281.1 hypothetical protein BX281_8400 [Streptomyces sp. Ag82_O1-15]
MNTPKLLAHTSLAAGVVFTATAEYSLARKMGAMEAVAVMLPVAIDAYAVAALKRFRSFDITLSLLLMGAAQVSAHLLDSHVMRVNGWLVVIVSLLVPVAIWRTHALARDDDPTPAEPVEAFNPESLPPVEVERVPEMPPALEAVVLAAEEPRTRVSAPVPDDDDELLARTRQDFHGQIPTYRDLKEKYGIGQARARRIRAVLEGDLS